MGFYILIAEMVDLQTYRCRIGLFNGGRSQSCQKQQCLIDSWLRFLLEAFDASELVSMYKEIYFLKKEMIFLMEVSKLVPLDLLDFCPTLSSNLGKLIKMLLIMAGIEGNILSRI